MCSSLIAYAIIVLSIYLDIESRFSLAASLLNSFIYTQNEPFSTIHGAHGARIGDVHGFNAFAEILTETDF